MLYIPEGAKESGAAADAFETSEGGAGESATRDRGADVSDLRPGTCDAARTGRKTDDCESGAGDEVAAA